MFFNNNAAQKEISDSRLPNFFSELGTYFQDPSCKISGQKEK